MLLASLNYTVAHNRGKQNKTQSLESREGSNPSSSVVHFVNLRHLLNFTESRFPQLKH